MLLSSIRQGHLVLPLSVLLVPGLVHSDQGPCVVIVHGVGVFVHRRVMRVGGGCWVGDCLDLGMGLMRWCLGWGLVICLGWGLGWCLGWELMICLGWGLRIYLGLGLMR